MFSRIGERSHVKSDESKNNKKTAAAERKTLNENSFMEMLELGNVENDGKENESNNNRKREEENSHTHKKTR